MSESSTGFEKSYTVHGLRITRVALVDRGADQDAFVELIKRADSDTPDSPPNPRSGDPNKTEDMLPPVRGGKNMEKRMSVDLTKLREPIRKALGDEPEIPQEAVDALATAVEEAVEAAKTEGIEIGKAAPRATDADPYAELPEPLAKRLRDADAEKVELNKRLDAEIEKAAIRDATDLFKREFPALPGDGAALGALYHKLSKSLDKGDLDLVETVFRAGSNALAKMLQAPEVGTSIPISKELGDMEAKAQEILKSASTPMTIEAARIEAMAQNPDWYDAHVAALRTAK